MDLTKQVSPGIREMSPHAADRGVFRVAPEIHLLSLSAPHRRGSLLISGEPYSYGFDKTSLPWNREMSCRMRRTEGSFESLRKFTCSTSQPRTCEAALLISGEPYSYGFDKTSLPWNQGRCPPHAADRGVFSSRSGNSPAQPLSPAPAGQLSSSEESLIRMDLTKQVSPGIRGDVRRMRRTEGSFRVAPEIHLLNLSAPHLRGSSPHLRRALFVWI